MGDKNSRLLNGRYLLKDVLGSGGMATVYAATDTQLGREVAVKVFTTTADDDVLLRQDAEVSVLSSLSHHGLVTLLDAGVERDRRKPPRVFFVMELVTGSDLRQTLQVSGALKPRVVGLIGYDVAEALQYVHNRGVVHRDIKPSNILFVDYFDDSERARAKLTDFGIAHRGVERAADGATVTTGTAAYLSPEQVLRRDVGPPSDIYSLGLVLLQCFTTELAFPGEPAQSAVERVRRDPVIPDSLSDGWRAALSAMTARDPADRPTAREVVGIMRQLLVDDLAPAAAVTSPTAPKPNPFDDLTALAARTLSAPIAIMAMRPAGSEWLRREHGIDMEKLGKDSGRYTSANLYQAAWIEESASSDPRVLADPDVAAAIGLGFYASAPMHTSDGVDFAVLCVLDFEPRTLSSEQQLVLNDIAERAMEEFEVRLAHYLAQRETTTPSA